MATAEVRGISPEQQQAYGQIAGFFGRAEREFPAAAGQLVNVVGGLVGEQQTTQRKLQDGMANIDVGLALIGDWLKETGAEGFDVNLGFSGGAKKAIGRRQVKFPTASDLIRVGGKVNPELSTQIPPLLFSFSRQIRGGLDAGLSAKQIVGGLVAESVGSRLSANGSANLRATLNKPLGGHFEWIREALKIPDAAGQPGFTEKTAQPVRKEGGVDQAQAKPAEAVSPAEREFQRKKLRIMRYLISEEGKDFLSRTWDEDKWEHVGEDGSVKRVYRPLRGVLAGEEVCLRENISDQVISYRESAPIFRPETRFLQNVKGPHFVRVYARAPLDQTDSEGAGNYRADRHWELVDFVDGVAVKRVVDRESDAIIWPGPLSPAVRLRVVLAACENEREALNLARPVYLTDLKTDAFIVSPGGDQIKQVDCQVHDESVDFAREVIGKELVRLCLELFPWSDFFPVSDVEKAIGWYLNPQQYENDKRWFYGGQKPPILTEILGFSRSALPDGVESAILGFLDEIKAEKSPVGQIPMRLAERILPIAQRLEREEGAVRAEKLAAEKRQEIQRRAAEKSAKPAESKTENWEGAVKKLIEDPFTQIVYEQTQSVIAAAAAYGLNAEISNGSVGEDQFISLVKRIAALSQNMRQEKTQPQLLLQWPAHQRLFLEDEISRTAYEATGSIVAAAAAFSLREEIIGGTIAEEKFVPFVREVATLVQKTRNQTKH